MWLCRCAVWMTDDSGRIGVGLNVTAAAVDPAAAAAAAGCSGQLTCRRWSMSMNGRLCLSACVRVIDVPARRTASPTVKGAARRHSCRVATRRPGRSGGDGDGQLGEWLTELMANVCHRWQGVL